MSKFFEALEQAARDRALRDQAASPPVLGGPAMSVAPVAVADVDPTFAEPPRTAAPAELIFNDTTRMDEHVVSLLDPASFEAEQYRVLRHVVETLRKSASLQVIAVTSPCVGDGKTTTAVNLAGALAQSTENRVLLLDMDFRAPAVAAQLGLNGARRSLMDALLGPRLSLEHTVEVLPRFSLSILPAGTSAVAPYELLRSPRLEALLQEARERYDYVVLDTPPFTPVPDGRLIAKYVDGFVIVVTAHRTPRGVLAETLDLMDPVKVVGLVFNGDGVRHSRYYNGSPGSRRGNR
jgi:capsular exopolysaccharide synthesis family protein